MSFKSIITFSSFFIIQTAFPLNFCTTPGMCQITIANNSNYNLILKDSNWSQCVNSVAESNLPQTINSGDSFIWSINVHPDCPLSEVNLSLKYSYDQNGGYPLYCTFTANLQKPKNQKDQNLNNIYLQNSRVVCDPPMTVSGANNNFALISSGG